MDKKRVVCPDCDAVSEADFDRRGFLKAVGAGAAAAALPLWAVPKVEAAPTPTSAAETAVKGLYETLTDTQKKEICFEWDYLDPKRGLLRTHVSNNWQITKPHIKSDFYTPKQQQIIHDVFKGIINPEWYTKFLKQLKDDTGGQEWGNSQSIAIFGTPGSNKFEFVMTGRHMTIRADGHSEAHAAFGGPIFYGHAASGFNEKVHHPGNVFWHQAEMANKVYRMLEPRQQKESLLEKLPDESAVAFQGSKAKFPGIPVAELANEQKKELQKVLMALVEPYRKEDQEEALECLKRQGGIDHCNLAFYKEGDIGNDGEWDNWRLEGPSFVWYFRGYPHVHVWVNVGDDPSTPLNARG
jgi:hypothetical protein